MHSDLSNLDFYGIDEGETPELQSCNNVSVPECSVVVLPEQDAELRRILGDITDDEYGIRKYLTVIDYMEHL